MKKRVLAIAMTLAMTLSLLPVSALAAGTGETQPESLTQDTESQVQEVTVDKEIDEGIQSDVSDRVENPVAMIEDVGYATLEKAFEEAAEGATIQMQKDTTLNGAINVRKDITLDLNGKTITSDSSARWAFAVGTSGVTFTIDDTATGGTIKSARTDNSNVIVVSAGNLVVKNGTLENNWYVVYVSQSGTATIEGGTLKSKVASALSTNGSSEGEEDYSGDAVMNVKGGHLISEQDVTIYVPAGTLKVSGGTIEGCTAIYVKSGTTSITGGTIKGTGNKEDYRYVGGGCAPTGDAVVIDACGYPNGDPAIEISGGNFESEKASAVADYQHGNNEAKKILVTGGTFDSNVSKYIPSGMKQEGGEVVIDNEKAVASVNGVGYDDLQEAVDAVTMTNQTTIKLLKPTSGAGVKVDGTVKRNLTFDLGGHTYTITSGVGSTGTETNGFQLIKDNNITITNGTITAAPAEGQQVKILIQNYSNLTLENVTLDGRGMTDYNGLNYTLSNNNGEITLKSGTVIQARADEIAMDVCWAESYQDGARVTVEEGAEIQGTVELGLWGQDAYSNNQSVLTVNGGTITGEVKLDSSISEDKISETIESLKTNVTINGGTFGSNVDAYVDDTDDANAHVARNGQYTYYETVQDALDAAQPGDSVVALTSTPGSTLYTVTLNYGYDSNRATIQVASDTKISLPDPGTRTGYTFNGWYNGSSYVGREGTEVTITSNIIYTADWTRNQTERPSSSGSSSSDRTYSIDVDVTGSRGGSVTLSPTRASAGTRVTITVRPNSGYELDELTVLDEDGDEVRLTQRTDTTYTFHMPDGKVTVEAAFTLAQTQTPQTTFADVPASAWYYNAVEYVYENGLMSGVSGGRFAPDDTLTRAMLVQTLYAMEGRPAAASAGFADVASGDWYASAVNWAAANGVVSGVSETGFGPNNALTREQLALILYRFAQYKGYDVTGTSDLAAYADGSSVSSWAAEAMGWAVDAGLISGVGGNQIAPTGTASRAQVAQILMNFCENVAR